MKDSSDVSEEKKSKHKKVAGVLLALEPDAAASVLQKIDSSEHEKIIAEMLAIPPLTVQEKSKLLSNFLREMDVFSISQGGVDKALEFLRQSFGEKKAKTFAQKMQFSEIHKSFSELEKFSTQSLANLLQLESEQTVAVVLSQLKANHSAKILSLLDEKKRALVIRKIANLKRVSPEALHIIFLSLKEKLEKYEENFIEHEGEKRLTEILRHLDSQVEKNILSELEKTDQDLAERMHASIYAFEDLLQLAPREIRKLIETMPSAEIWAKALKGAGRKLIRHILSSLSINRSADITEEMKYLKKLPLSEVERKRKIIMQKVVELENEGILFLQKNRHDLVD